MNPPFAQNGVARRRFKESALRGALVLAAIVGSVFALRDGASFDVPTIARLMGSLGWVGFLLYVGYSLLVFGLLGASWLLVMGASAHRLPAFTWARMLREAAADFLPFSQIGGIVVGADSLIARGLPGPSVYASLTADLTTEMASQALFTAMGICLYATKMPNMVDISLVSAVIASFAGITLILVIAGSTPRWLPVVAPKILARLLPSSLPVVHEVADRLREIYAARARLVAATSINFVAWSMSAAGAWIVLRLAGTDLPLTDVLALEAFIFALRSVAFMVPGGIGVQEAGYALAASAFGLPIEAAVVLAIAKRCKDLAIGLPTLVAWQVVQAGRVVGVLKRSGRPRAWGASRR